MIVMPLFLLVGRVMNCNRRAMGRLNPGLMLVHLHGSDYSSFVSLLSSPPVSLLLGF